MRAFRLAMGRWFKVAAGSAVLLSIMLVGLLISRRKTAPPKAALEVTLIGHQYWWEIRYPQLGVVTANELHVPVSGPGHLIPIRLTMTSADADHSLTVPGLDWKADVSPNDLDTATLSPQTVGVFPGQCAKNCGSPESGMLIRVYVDTPASFRAWAAHQKATATQDENGRQGRTIFEHTVCMSCHTVRGTVASGSFGPDLTHVASRDTIAGGSLANTQQNLRAFIDNPPQAKPGCLMPAMHLNPHDLDAVTEYISSLK
jgi:cytochrome c oxidase subunit 2